MQKLHDEIFPGFKSYCENTVLLNKVIYGMMLSGKYWYEEAKDWMVSVNFKVCPTCPVIFIRK
jgi:hypothetical protein